MGCKGWVGDGGEMVEEGGGGWVGDGGRGRGNGDGDGDGWEMGMGDGGDEDGRENGEWEECGRGGENGEGGEREDGRWGGECGRGGERMGGGREWGMGFWVGSGVLGGEWYCILRMYGCMDVWMYVCMDVELLAFGIAQLISRRMGARVLFLTAPG